MRAECGTDRDIPSAGRVRTSFIVPSSPLIVLIVRARAHARVARRPLPTRQAALPERCPGIDGHAR